VARSQFALAEPRKGGAAIRWHSLRWTVMLRVPLVDGPSARYRLRKNVVARGNCVSASRAAPLGASRIVTLRAFPGLKEP
jgi:hypothetical protein